MGFFSKKRKTRKLVNGEQNEIQITTEANIHSSADWWADTYHLIKNLSKGDRSTIIAALQMSPENQTQLMTAKGSVTNELWNRLTFLGYLTERPLSDEIPNEHHDQFSSHLVTDMGREKCAFFIMAATATMNEAQEGRKAILTFTKNFMTLDKFHYGLNIEQLNALRDMFFSQAKSITPVEGSGQERIWRAYENVGAFETNQPGIWQVEDLAARIAPFILDKAIHQKIETLH